MAETYAPIKLHDVEYDEFETIREEDRLQVEEAYRVSYPWGGENYAWSPDGIGCYWYETFEELEAAHA